MYTWIAVGTVSLTNKVRLSAALLALLTLLVVNTASVLPGHGHENDSARPCDICHSGHLPCGQPSGHVQLHAQMPVTWRHTAEDSERRFEPISVIQTPRAPPA